MTDHRTADRAAADPQRARIEALRQRRASPAGASVPPAEGSGPRRQRRRHAAERSRVGVAAVSVATMLGLVGVMGLSRQASSATPSAPAGSSPASPPATGTAPAAPGVPAVSPPPVALTARPSVQASTPTATAPVARTNGSR